jgi:hypothetical protein
MRFLWDNCVINSWFFTNWERQLFDWRILWAALIISDDLNMRLKIKREATGGESAKAFRETYKPHP